jgi:HOOK domain
MDGLILHQVYLQIDPEPQHHPIKIVNADDVHSRVKNFDAISRNLRNLYEEELGQIILALPNCSVLGQHPESRAGLDQMRLLLILLLGAAVQCPNKELFISRIKELDVVTQHAIVELIKQVTDMQSLVFSQENWEQLKPETVSHHIVRLAKERDMYHSNWIQSFCNEAIDAMGKSGSTDNSPGNSSASNALTPSTASSLPDNNHLAVELADSKSRLRKLRQEL